MNLKIERDENQLSVDSFGRVARIGRVNQEGLMDKVDKKRVGVSLPGPPLLGF